jgi:peptidyl-prolyl cis-trans isomerase SurA
VRAVTAAVSLAVLVAMPLGTAHAEVVERIVAIVNGDVVTQSELDMRLRSMQESPKTRLNELERETRKRAALNSLISEALLNHAIERAKIEVTDEELSRAIRNILAQNGMSMNDLRTEVAKKGMTFDEYRSEVEAEVKKIKFVNQVISPEVKVTDRDLRDYYDKNRSRYHGGKEVHVAEILLPIAGVKTEAEAFALRDRAILIVKQARENKSAFARLAKKYSQGPNADQGGDLGTLRIDDMPERVAEVVRSLPEGGVSDPIPTDNAVVIVKVIKWPEASDDDFNTVRDSIYERVHQARLQEALNSYVQRLRQHAYIEVR